MYTLITRSDRNNLKYDFKKRCKSSRKTIKRKNDDTESSSDTSIVINKRHKTRNQKSKQKKTYRDEKK